MAFQDISSHHDRIPRNVCIADSDIYSSRDLFGTYRRKTDTPYMSGGLALGTDAVRTRVRLAVVS